MQITTFCSLMDQFSSSTSFANILIVFENTIRLRIYPVEPLFTTLKSKKFTLLIIYLTKNYMVWATKSSSKTQSNNLIHFLKNQVTKKKEWARRSQGQATLTTNTSASNVWNFFSPFFFFSSHFISLEHEQLRIGKVSPSTDAWFDSFFQELISCLIKLLFKTQGLLNTSEFVVLCV